jgi:Queuine tRNA-ribosyltransferase
MKDNEKSTGCVPSEPGDDYDRGGDEESDSSSDNYIKEAPATSATARSAAAPDVRLLLHTEDGVVPFLTPALLKQAFPVDSVRDVLLLGLAVRDTCVVPVYYNPETNVTKSTKTSNRKAKKSRVETISDVVDGTAAVAATASKSAPLKPRGYTFAEDVPCDSWLLEYRRVTVPTFDPLRDVYGDPNDVAASLGRKGSKLDFSNASSMDSKMALWTPNGRQTITPPQYCASVQGLSANTCVPLFEPILPVLTSTTKVVGADKSNTAAAAAPTAIDVAKRNKRKQAVVQRNKAWTDEASSKLLQKRVWAPFAVEPGDDSIIIDEMDHEHMEWIAKKMEDDTTKIQGYALIGWHHVDNPTRRDHVLQAVRSSLTALAQRTPPLESQSSAKKQCLKPTIAVLSTRSMVQILELLQFASSATSSDTKPTLRIVIGTDLPTRWARSKRAFLVDWSVRTMPTVTNGSNTSTNTSAPVESLSSIQLDQDGCYDLNPPVDGTSVKQHPWFLDQGPLMKGCSCLTCRTHSRAYVYHLVCAKELLAEMLLFIHNLHHLLASIRSVNKGLVTNTAAVQELCRHIEQQMMVEKAP